MDQFDGSEIKQNVLQIGMCKEKIEYATKSQFMSTSGTKITFVWALRQKSDLCKQLFFV